MAYPYQMPYQTPYSPYLYQQPFQAQPIPQQAQQPAQPVQQPLQQPIQQQIQNGGFMSVHSVEEAYNWPIAPGVGMTFKVENAPVVCTKSRGFSPLEEPVFKVFDMQERIQQQTVPVTGQEAPEAPAVVYAERADVEALQREIEAFKADLEAVKNQPIVAEIKRTTSKTKKEAEE